MEIKKSIQLFLDALETLKDGIDLFHEYEEAVDKHLSEKNIRLFKSMRDSLIQRFEYTVDLFWKTTKTYMIEVEKIDVLVQSPRGIIREAIKAKVFSEDEGNECMDMVEARNKTSHSYLEVMADEIANTIPMYYNLLSQMGNRIKNALK